MDYLFDALVDPTEFEFEFKNNTKFRLKPVPDTYRKYLFGLKYSITYIDDPKIMAETTNTKEKYWNGDDVVLEIISEIKNYKKLPPHLLTDYLNGKIILAKNIQKYYKNIYNLADIIIIKANNYDDNKFFIYALKELFNMTNFSTHIVHRLVFYMSVYYIKKNLGKSNMRGYISMMISKIEEFNAEPNIWKFFTKKEMNTYMCYIKKIEAKYNKLISS